MNKSPCKECNKRQLLCHSTCLLYKDFTKTIREIKTKNRLKNEAVKFQIIENIKRKNKWAKKQY